VDRLMVYEFGPFRLEEGERRLRCDARVVPLTPKALDTLLVLVANAGRAVGKDELMQAIWPDAAVEEATLAQNVFAVRKALGETPYIETVPKFGYRFTGSVREVHSGPQKILLAVLPFENLGPDGEEYFSDGLTEEMITQLGRLNPALLGVIARASVMQYKATRKTVSDIGRELRVSYLLGGSVRRAGGRVRVAAQLIDVRDQAQLWAESYDRDAGDILKLQADVVEAIAAEIQLKLTPHTRRRLDRADAIKPEAYEDYLRGRFLWNKRTRTSVDEAVRHFEKAIAADPGTALAYSALADCHLILGSLLWIPPKAAAAKANAALAHALRLDDSLAEPHAALGFVRAQYEYRWKEAEESFQRALELNANYATAHHWFSFLLAALGRHDEAIREVRRAEALDPFSPIIGTNVATVLFWARQPDAAIAQCRTVLGREPDFWIAHFTLGSACEQTGDYTGAVRAQREAIALEGGSSPVLAASLARACALAGQRDEAVRLVAGLRDQSCVSLFHLAAAHVALGEHDAAFRCLGESCAQGEFWAAFLAVDPRLDSLRDDPRHLELLRRLRLPESSDTGPKAGSRFTGGVRDVRESASSLVVLPLENLSGDPAQEYFADGLTETLIAELAQVHGLRVISRTSAMHYKGARKPIPQIARELNVDAAVEGSVVCAGDRVRITARLVDARRDATLWSRPYEYHVRDVLAWQAEVAAAITAEIQASVTRTPRAAPPRQVDTDAYRNYLRGRFSWNKRTEEGVTKALDYFRAAIAGDPKYALAYTGIADAYAMLGDWEIAAASTKEMFARSREAVREALALEPDLGEARNSLAHLHFHALDWASADLEWRTAIELSPGFSTARHWYAHFLSSRGRHDEALEQIRMARDLDPLSLPIQQAVADIAYYARRGELAVEECRRALEMDPRFERSHRLLGDLALEDGRIADAIAAFTSAVDLTHGSAETLAALARGYARAGDTAALDRTMEAIAMKPYVSPYTMATIRAAQGDIDAALALLRTAFEQEVAALPYIGIDPRLDPLRADPRFDKLLNRVGLNLSP
jgi:TolB-like protein/Tfp pilus assembly protein PilF